MINKIWEILTTLTDEAQNAVLKKCIELGFDTTRGVVSLDESFINLSSARSILMDAIEKQKLTQLPITVQQTILSFLETISSHQTNLLNGSDQVVNLVVSIEQLNTAIWQYGLFNLSNEVLGYQTKLNQLKKQELEIKELSKQLQGSIQQKTELERLLNEVNKSVETIKLTVASAEENNKKIAENLSKAIELEQKSAASFVTTQQNESNSTQLLAATKTSNAEVAAIEGKIKEFFGQIDTYRTKISKTSDDASAAVGNNNAKTAELIDCLKKLEDQIKDQLQKATGYSLFHSFQTRQIDLSKSKKFWIYALAAMVAISLALTIYIMLSTENVGIAFYVKLSMSLPLIYAITFCTVQYSRERKLEEEYAFKSNISVSLIPYQELVDKIVDSKSTVEKEKYAAFIIESINKVFTSPTEKIFDGDVKNNVLADKNIKQLSKLLEPIAKLLKP